MFVSDKIGDEYRNWKPGQIILINTPTGSGKTYFILNTLLPYIAEQGEHMLYLSNRTALRDQVGQAYDQRFSENICVMNYQKFEKLKMYNNEYLSDYAESGNVCTYFVMDEAHYFLFDASFNGSIGGSLEKIKARKKDAILIFITAAPEYLLLSLAASGIIDQLPPPHPVLENIGKVYYECKSYFSKAPIVQRFSRPETLFKYKELWDDCFYYVTQNTVNFLDIYKKDIQQRTTDIFDSIKYFFRDSYAVLYEQGFFSSIKGKYYSYTIKQDYSYIIPTYFKHLSELCERIMSTSSEEKWLIFVPSIKIGTDLNDILMQLDREIDSVVIQSRSKNVGKKELPFEPRDRIAYRKIVQESKLLNRVTISTAVLDNGINIHDQTLKHIAILDMNQTSFLQMLGRKRINRGLEERVNVYFWAKDIGEVKAYFNQTILRHVKFLIEFKFVQQFDGKRQADSRPLLQNCFDFQRDYQENGSFILPFSRYLTSNTSGLSPEKGLRDYTFRLFKTNDLPIARLTYDYYRFAALLERYTNLSNDEKVSEKEVYWLKYQLSWLGIEYDPKCWIDYPKHTYYASKMEEFVERFKGKSLDKDQQNEFKKYFIGYTRTSHPPLIPKQNKASLLTINRIFRKYEVPLKVESFVVKRKTFWRIISTS